MKAVQVKYTVRPEYVAENKANILKVMERLKEQPIEGMFYSSHLLEDGQTFVHINVSRDQETLSKLAGIEEFDQFRTALKASQPLSPPQSTQLNTIGAGFEV
ncbi:MAG: hypothetical protein HEP71_06050 [Roseivirga sp.]|nr:hypothetical protein [Roseivirga sp.]